MRKRILLPIALAGAAFAVLFVPPVRNRFFTTKLWPWRTPWDVTPDQLDELKSVAQPGDVVIESNLHGWQWIALCYAATGTTWVHAALVDGNKQLITVHKQAIEADWSIYLDWGSTRMALIRPPYENEFQRQEAIDFARAKVGTPYDASFTDHSGNCNGLVASALQHSGVPVETRHCMGRPIYPGDCFLHIPGARIIWES